MHWSIDWRSYKMYQCHFTTIETCAYYDAHKIVYIIQTCACNLMHMKKKCFFSPYNAYKNQKYESNRMKCRSQSKCVSYSIITTGLERTHFTSWFYLIAMQKRTCFSSLFHCWLWINNTESNNRYEIGLATFIFIFIFIFFLSILLWSSSSWSSSFSTMFACVFIYRTLYSLFCLT